MKPLIGYIKVVNSINEKIGKATSWLTLLLVVSYDVIVRYLFDSNYVALQKLRWHIFAIRFLHVAALFIIIIL